MSKGLVAQKSTSKEFVAQSSDSKKLIVQGSTSKEPVAKSSTSKESVAPAKPSKLSLVKESTSRHRIVVVINNKNRIEDFKNIVDKINEKLTPGQTIPKTFVHFDDIKKAPIDRNDKVLLLRWEMSARGPETGTIEEIKKNIPTLDPLIIFVRTASRLEAPDINIYNPDGHTKADPKSLGWFDALTINYVLHNEPDNRLKKSHITEAAGIIHDWLS